MINLYFTIWHSKTDDGLEYDVGCEPEMEPGPGFWGVYSRKEDLDEIVDVLVPEIVKKRGDWFLWNIKPYGDGSTFQKRKIEKTVMYTSYPSAKMINELNTKIELAIEKYGAGQNG